MYTVLNVVLGPEIVVTFICNESQVQEVVDFIGVCDGSAVDIIEQVEANFDCRAVSPTTYDPFNWHPAGESKPEDVIAKATMKTIKSGNKVIGIIFQDDFVMSDTVSGDYASHIEAPEENTPLSVAEYITSVLESNSQYDRFGNITVDDMPTQLSLKDMAHHLIKILVDNMQPDPEVLAEAIWDLFMPVPFPSLEEQEESSHPCGDCAEHPDCQRDHTTCPYAEGSHQEAGICPVCGSTDLDYDSLKIDNGQVCYPWTCNTCKSSGEEWSDLYFTEHTNIIDATQDDEEDYIKSEEEE